MANRHVLIVGAGISGCTLAERFASSGDKVVIIDQRSHVGGNCYDYINDAGIRINKYGPHYFRTNDEVVWEYVNRFSEWTPFEAKCLSVLDGKKVPIPVNINTVNMLFGLRIENEQQMKKWLSSQVLDIAIPKNSEESALKRMGLLLYKKMFENYTLKQWNKHPRELDPSIMDRIPIRFNWDDRYFTEKYQAYPSNGYTQWIYSMLSSPSIEVVLSQRYEDFNSCGFDNILFTGRIDSYFHFKFGSLEYRSLVFDEETLDVEFFQDAVQENYPDAHVPFTRIVEYKRQTHHASLNKTTIVREYPSGEGEPFYPILSPPNILKYQSYQNEAKIAEKDGVYFLGRLANYKYFNMDQAIRNALDFYAKFGS